MASDKIDQSRQKLERLIVQPRDAAVRAYQSPEPSKDRQAIRKAFLTADVIQRQAHILPPLSPIVDRVGATKKPLRDEPEGLR